MTFNPARFAKATNAAIGALLTGLAVILAANGGVSIIGISGVQWSALLVGVGYTAWTTYNTPNADPVAQQVGVFVPNQYPPRLTEKV